VPYFASLGAGERELAVLRSEDGESWTEHSTEATFVDRAWAGEEGELYQDVVASTDLRVTHISFLSLVFGKVRTPICYV